MPIYLGDYDLNKNSFKTDYACLLYLVFLPLTAPVGDVISVAKLLACGALFLPLQSICVSLLKFVAAPSRSLSFCVSISLLFVMFFLGTKYLFE